MRIGASEFVLLICTLFPFAAKSAGISGSSVLISWDGYLITAEHVIAGCASLNAVNIGPVMRWGMTKSTIWHSLNQTHPLQGNLADLNVTNGIVSALGNASQQLQFTAPVQPGNSGGALLDRSGALAGILTLRFTARFGFVRGGFAVRREAIQAFLAAQSVRPVLVDNKPEQSREEIAELARKSVFAIECLN